MKSQCPQSIKARILLPPSPQYTHSLTLPRTHTHAFTYIYMYTYIHTYIQTRTHTHTLSLSLSLFHSLTQTHTPLASILLCSFHSELTPHSISLFLSYTFMLCPLPSLCLSLLRLMALLPILFFLLCKWMSPQKAQLLVLFSFLSTCSPSTCLSIFRLLSLLLYQSYIISYCIVLHYMILYMITHIQALSLFNTYAHARTHTHTHSPTHSLTHSHTNKHTYISCIWRLQEKPRRNWRSVAWGGSGHSSIRECGSAGACQICSALVSSYKQRGVTHERLMKLGYSPWKRMLERSWEQWREGKRNIARTAVREKNVSIHIYIYIYMFICMYACVWMNVCLFLCMWLLFYSFSFFLSFFFFFPLLALQGEEMQGLWGEDRDCVTG